MKCQEKALEAYLVVAARAGDRRAWQRLVELRGPRLMAHAVRLLGEAEGARDVVQDAWLDILRGLSRLREVGAFLPWALRIVSRRVARVIKGRQGERRLAAGYSAEAELSVRPGRGRWTQPGCAQRLPDCRQIRRRRWRCFIWKISALPRWQWRWMCPLARSRRD